MRALVGRTATAQGVYTRRAALVQGVYTRRAALAQGVYTRRAMGITFTASDAWLLLSIAGASTPSRGASVRDVIAVGDYLNHAIFSFEEFDTGLARLRLAKLASVRGARLNVTAQGRGLCDVARQGRGGLFALVDQLHSRLSARPAHPAPRGEAKIRRRITRAAFTQACTEYSAGNSWCRVRLVGDIASVEERIDAEEAYRSAASIRCPACGWRPNRTHAWSCACGHSWNTFETRARCPQCEKQWEETACLACQKLSPHAAWYGNGTPG